MSDLPRCPACGCTLELHDTMDVSPPIPTRAWPPRWAVSNGEGGTWEDCPDCGTELDARAIAVAAGLPADYPWVMADELLDQAVDVFHTEYRKNFPSGGDECDHRDAERAGIEAIIALVTTPPPAMCPVCHHPVEAHGPGGCEKDSFSTGRCFCSRAASGAPAAVAPTPAEVVPATGEYGLVLPFDREGADFCHGVEVGRLWEQMKAAPAALDGQLIHAVNAEMVMRMAEVLDVMVAADFTDDEVWMVLRVG